MPIFIPSDTPDEELFLKPPQDWPDPTGLLDKPINETWEAYSNWLQEFKRLKTLQEGEVPFIVPSNAPAEDLSLPPIPEGIIETKDKKQGWEFSNNILDWGLSFALGPAYMVMDTFTEGGAVTPSDEYNINNPDSKLRKMAEGTVLDLDIENKIGDLGSWFDDFKSGIGSWFDKWKWWGLLIILLGLGAGGLGLGLSRKAK